MKNQIDQNQSPKTKDQSPQIQLESHHDPRRELIARAIIIRDNCLLVNRGFNARRDEEYFALPGGHVDPGESCVRALEREIEEELATTIVVGDLVFVSESVYEMGRKNVRRRHEIVLFFRAELSGELRQDGDSIWSPEPKKRFRWLSIAELSTANLYPPPLKPILMGQTTPLYSFDDFA